MVISHRTVRGGFLAAAMAGSVFLGATACAGGDDEPSGEASGTAVSGERLCGGDAVSAGAAGALKVITGSSRFEESAAGSTVAHAAEELSGTLTSSTVGDGEICRIFTAAGTPETELKITWELSGGAPTDTPASKFTVLKMGERTLAATDGASLRFACRSEKLPGSGTAHVGVAVERGGMPAEPEGDAEAVKGAYATVAHSVSLAMAGELGCDANGGLPAQPVLDPA